MTALPFFLLLLIGCLQGQKFPSRDEDLFQFHLNHDEIFHDTRVLPDGASVQVYLLQSSKERYFFIVEEDDCPLKIAITPCSPQVTWQILFQEPLGEGSTSDDYDLYMDQEKTTPPKGEKLLANFSAGDPNVFLEEHGAAGIYSILVTNAGNDSTVHLYATSTPHSDHRFPQLPNDHHVHVLRTTDTSVTVSWKAVISKDHNFKDGIKYCIAVNKQRDFVSECDASTFVFGETQPTLPPHAGFGFSWEEEEEAKFLSKASPRPPSSDASYTCINSKTHYTFAGAKPSETYFINVFAIDRSTNASSVYQGVEIRTQNRQDLVALKDNHLHTDFLKSPRLQRTFSYDLDNDSASLSVIVSPCADSVQVRLRKEDRLLRSARIKNLEQFDIMQAERGRYFLEVSSRKAKSTSFQIFVSANSSENPFPQLPSDRTIRVEPRTCRSVRVSWRGTSERQEYCLFVSRHSTSSHQHKNCFRHPRKKKAERVICRKFRSRGSTGSLMAKTISGLTPNATYTFNVFVQKHNGHSVRFLPVLASTSRSCL